MQPEKKRKSFWSILRAENCCEFFHKQLTWPRRRQLGKTRARHSRNSFMARSLKLIGLAECGRREGGQGYVLHMKLRISANRWLPENVAAELTTGDGKWHISVHAHTHAHVRQLQLQLQLQTASHFPFQFVCLLCPADVCHLQLAGRGREKSGGGVATNAKVHAMTFRFGCTCQRGVYATRARIFCSTYVINKCRRTHTYTLSYNWHAKVYIASISKEIYV